MYDSYLIPSQFEHAIYSGIVLTPTHLELVLLVRANKLNICGLNSYLGVFGIRGR